MAKELRSSQIFWNGSAIYRYKRSLGATTLRMNASGNILFSRTTGSCHQHRHIRWCHQTHMLIKHPCCRTLSLNIQIRLRQGRGRCLCYHGFRIRSQRLVDLVQQLFWIQRFSDVIRCSRFHGQHRTLNLRIPGHQNNGYGRTLAFHPMQQRNAITVRQTKIRQNQVVKRSLHTLLRLLDRGDGLHTEPLLTQPSGQHQ